MDRLRRVAWIPVLRAVAVIGFVLCVAAAIAWFPAGEQIVAWVDGIRGQGRRGMFLFALTYAFGTVLLVPASPFPVAAGFLWGPWVGFGISWASELVGASVAYALGRSVLRDRVSTWLRRWPVFAALDTALDEQGLLLLLLVRLSPVFPFGPLNYALGVSGVRPVAYLVATGLGVVPLCLVASWAGSALPHLEAVLAGEEAMGLGALPYWGGLATTVLSVYAVTRATRRALAKRIRSETPAA